MSIELGRTYLGAYSNGLLHDPLLARFFHSDRGPPSAAASAHADRVSSARHDRTDGHDHDVRWLQDWPRVFRHQVKSF